jgi:hypothetical protein
MTKVIPESSDEVGGSKNAYPENPEGLTDIKMYRGHVA